MSDWMPPGSNTSIGWVRSQETAPSGDRQGSDLADLREALEGMVNQFAYWGGEGITTGGLSALEEAFAVLGYSDPQPAPWRGCDEPGCRGEGTSGWPSPDGYRHTCHEHSDWHQQRRCNYPPLDAHFAALAPKEAKDE